MNPASGWPPPEFSPAKRDGRWRSPGYRSSWLRARVLLGILGLTIVASAIGVAQELSGLALLDRATLGLVTDAEATAFDEMAATTGLVQAALYYLTAFGLFGWLSRAVENVPPLTGFTPERSPREAIGWWFVPFASYVLPFTIVDDTITRLRTSPERGAERLVLPWWLLFILSLFGNVALIVLSRQITDLESARVVLTTRLAVDGLDVASGVLLVLVIRAIERRSDTRAAMLGLGRTGVPTWPLASYAQPEPSPAEQQVAPANEHLIERIEVTAEGPLAPPPPPG